MFNNSTSILQGAGGGIQGSSPTIQAGSNSGLRVQPAAQQNLQVTTAPGYGQTLSSGGGSRSTASLTPSSAATVDPNAAANAAAAAAAAAKAAQAAQLRDQITGLVGNIKDIFNSRYGQVDASGGEQVGKLNDRFGQESADLTHQITDQVNQTGGAFAGRGTRDSSDYGNAVDEINQAGQSQIGTLGNELHDNIAKIAQWVQQQKSGFDAQKGGYDAIVSHLADEQDPNNLITLRNTIDSKIADLKGGNADNNTEAQNLSALESIAPSSGRAQQLQTTLSKIMGGNADANTKASIAGKLIASAGLAPADAQKLQQAVQTDLAASQQPQTA